MSFLRRFRPAEPPRPQTREALILKHAAKSGRGLEIGPNAAPIAPKRLGFDCLSMDVFPTEEVRRRAIADPNVPAERISDIEEVDLIGTAVEIGPLVTQNLGAHSLDYVVSSHNFEHIPDPIRFLQGCEIALKDGGHLSMAIPDLRCCFDYFRWPSTLAEWLSAYVERRRQPSAAQHFAASAVLAQAHLPHGMDGSFTLNTPREQISMERLLDNAYRNWMSWLEQPNEDYQDCHCWAFTPSSLAQIILEARFLGLVTLEVAEVSDLHGGEFFIHLRNSGAPAPDPETFYPERERLARQAIREIAQKA